MEAKAFNEMTMRCQNPKCPDYGKDRTVTFPIVGKDIYLGGAVYCACGVQGECRVITG